MARTPDGRRRFLTFGYDRFRQLPIEIGTPGGRIIITREPLHNVRVDFEGDGARWADHTGEIETPAGGRAGSLTIRIIHEEKNR